MHFLPDVYVPCDVCHGKRYNRETLEVQYKGKNITEVLDLTVEDAFEYFKAVPVIARKLQTLLDVGLGYIKLGQSATTLSGGEAQRVKLSLELSKRDTGRTLYILDEPTTGLHFHDIAMLLKVHPRAARPRQHGRRHRAQPRRDQDGRLDRRPRSGRRRRRRDDRRAGHAGRRGVDAGELYRAVSRADPGPRGLGRVSRVAARRRRPADRTTGRHRMQRVTGIGGIFFTAQDPGKLRAWYQAHLGIDVQSWGGAAFDWVDADGKATKGTTAWSIGAAGDAPFAPGRAAFMVNYRVADLTALLQALRAEGCDVLDKVDDSPYGKFGWVVDPEGNKVELWEPPAGQ